MNSRNEILVQACQLCGATRLPVDIYKVVNDYQAKLTHLRKSKKFEMQATYEKDKITVRDDKGKTVYTVDLKKDQKPEKKESKQSKDI